MQLVRAEWTKFRTVRGWVVGTLVAALVMVLVGVVSAAGTRSFCAAPGSQTCPPPVPVGPDGEAVTDHFYFAHQPLDGDGSITVRVTSLTGLITYPPPGHNAIVPGVVAWAKAGIIIKESTRQGSPYAAVMVTGSHGVRVQYNYTHDTAGRSGGVSAASPRWLRLTRSGDTLTGYESADGTHWTVIGTAHLAGLPSTVLAGLFVASPGAVESSPGLAGQTTVRLTQATADLDHVSLEAAGASGAWTTDNIGGVAGGPALGQGAFKESGDKLPTRTGGSASSRSDR